MDFDLNGAVAMLLMYNVDFETLHGVDYKGEVRVCIIAHLATPVRLNFGDLKHARRVSRIHEADDHRKAVSPAQFKLSVKAHTLNNQWRTKTQELRDRVEF